VYEQTVEACGVVCEHSTDACPDYALTTCLGQCELQAQLAMDCAQAWLDYIACVAVVPAEDLTCTQDGAAIGLFCVAEQNAFNACRRS
jgi:hypothetical protein